MKKKTRIIFSVQAALLFLATVFMTSASPIAWAAPDPALVGGSAVIGYSGTATPITDLQLSGTGNPTVPVKLRVTSGTLSMATTTGLTFTGSSTGSTLQFSGTLTNVNTALASLTYTRGSTGTDTLEASLVNPGEVFFPDNGHLYEYVSATTTWNQAKTAAEGRTKYSATGYLTTITSQAENDFVAARLVNAGWMGASDVSVEGAWRWVTGPENTTQFWSGNFNGGTVGGNYANWNTGEPNDSSSNEDCGQFLSGSSGKWNDLPCSGTTLPGYVVEYGSGGSPIDVSSLNVGITTQAANQYPNTPSSLGPTSTINSSWSTNTAPSFSFSLSDNDAGNTVGYRIQVDDSADFSSPVVDYTSALATQGTANFAVGQIAGSGSYTSGSASQTLANGNYYWRVRAFDNIGASSSYTTANSGSIAFRVDTTAPSSPGQPQAASTPTTDTTPTLTWAASSDSGSGLASSTPYTIEWSQQADFTGAATATTASASYTLQPGEMLADGTWYFRVKATDAVNNISSYSPTQSIVVDTTAPSVPTPLIVTSAANIATPTISWGASTDTTTSLGTPSYTAEWSRQADFTGTVSIDATSLTSLTVGAPLSDGTWYFRVKAKDILDNESSYSAVAAINIDTTIKTTTPAKPSASSTPSSSQDTSSISNNPEFANESTDPPQASAQPIILDDFTEYTVGNGKELDLRVGQVIYFYLGSERHSVTIKEIHDDYIIATIASTPRDVRINRDGTLNYDVDQDGKDDIIISLQAVTNSSASILFKLPTKDPASQTSIVSVPKQTIGLNWWIIIAFVTVISVLTLYLAVRRRSRKNT